MKSQTKVSFIVFIVTFIMGFVVMSLIPDSMLESVRVEGSVLSFFGDEVVKIVGMRVVISMAIALVVTLLIRIVDNEQPDKPRGRRMAKSDLDTNSREKEKVVKEKVFVEETVVGVNTRGDIKTKEPIKKTATKAPVTKKSTPAKLPAKKNVGVQSSTTKKPAAKKKTSTTGTKKETVAKKTTVAATKKPTSAKSPAKKNVESKAKGPVKKTTTKKSATTKKPTGTKTTAKKI